MTGPLASAMGSLVPVDGSLVGSVVSSGTPIVTNDMDADPRSYRMPGQDVLLRTAAMVPLRSAGVVIGTVSVYNRRDGRPFTEHDLQLLETLGDQVVVGLDRARMLDEIRRNERDLAAKNVELERATRLKSEFLANMSHELRTPLNAIIGFSDLLLAGGLGELERAAEFLEAVLRNGRHLLALINSVLDLSKIEAGRMTLALAATDLREAITGAVADTASLRRAKQPAMRPAAGRRPASGRGRRRAGPADSVQSAVQRLQVHRARAARSPALRCAPAPAAGAGRPGGRRAALVTRGAVWVAVADTGIGIAPEDLPKLFQEFSQVDSSASRQPQGTGLGLASVTKVRGDARRDHRGGVHSGPRRTFWFILPAEGRCEELRPRDAAVYRRCSRFQPGWNGAGSIAARRSSLEVRRDQVRHALSGAEMSG